jgi:hypothetical protein
MKPAVIPDLTPAQIAAMPLTCDTCAATPGALLVFPYERFSVFYVDAGGPCQVDCAEGEWGACEECARLLLRRNVDALLKRAMEANPEASPGAAVSVRAVHAELVKHIRYGAITMREDRCT